MLRFTAKYVFYTPNLSPTPFTLQINKQMVTFAWYAHIAY